MIIKFCSFNKEDYEILLDFDFYILLVDMIIIRNYLKKQIN